MDLNLVVSQRIRCRIQDLPNLKTMNVEPQKAWGSTAFGGSEGNTYVVITVILIVVINIIS